MPIIKSAKKKLRKDIKRTRHNKLIELNLKKAITTALLTKKEETIKKAISQVAKAVKRNVIHKNKGARIASKLAKLVKPSSSKSSQTKKKSRRFWLKKGLSIKRSIIFRLATTPKPGDPF